MFTKSKSKVLLITFEYGSIIAGGIGRVANGIVYNNGKDIEYHVLHLQYNILMLKWYGYIYKKSDKKNKVLYKGPYIKVLLKAIKKEKYDTVHILANSKNMVECIKNIKELYPQVRIIYSCHSIAKYEIGIRNNKEEEIDSESFIVNNASHIQLLNNTSLNYLKESYAEVAQNKPISIIPNGIEETEYKAIDLKWRDELLNELDKDNNLVVLCMSRWSFGKGLEYLLEAVPKVTEQYKNVKFVLAGRKTSSWENKVKDYVTMIDKQISNLNNIIPLGWLTDVERNTIMSLADLWIMPSLLEYFPYSILEPMVCKIPIISSRIDSVVELLEENNECLFYSPQNPTELAEKILSLAYNEESRSELAKNAYQKVKQIYTWETISDMYLTMYQSD
jgi:glycosyltransferase involved in cell wall biosynthesis